MCRVYRAATAVCLTAIVVMQVVDVHVCRTRRLSVWFFILPFAVALLGFEELREAAVRHR